MTERPNLTFADVAGLNAAKQALREAVIMPMRLPHLFTGATAPWKGILLYGPPGTGKSFLAKALAGEAGDVEFLTVTVADLVSKWIGESEKLIRSLFELARARRPSIVFIDEIDSLVSKRDGGGQSSEAGRRIQTEFLVQLDGVSVDNRGVLLVSATNLPWDIDAAMRRRFEKRIYIPLPDAHARRELLDHKLAAASVELSDAHRASIVARTEGFSGADLSILMRDALMAPIREIQQAHFFKRGPAKDDTGAMRDDMWIVCGSKDPGAVATTWDQLPPSDIGVPIASSEHFARAMKNVKASVAPADLEKYSAWTREFGEEGS
jgi:vacuolar protein-sorting-associated protein 4